MTKPSKPAVVRARCAREIKSAVARIARAEQLDEADIVRRALALYIARFSAQPST